RPLPTTLPPPTSPPFPYTTLFRSHHRRRLRYPIALNRESCMRFLPHVTVATIVERQGRFLMVEDISGNPVVFNQPAGHLEADESLMQAARRDTLEETAWTVELTGVPASICSGAPMAKPISAPVSRPTPWSIGPNCRWMTAFSQPTGCPSRKSAPANHDCAAPWCCSAYWTI